MNEVEILVISNKYDFTSDYICLELKKRGLEYCRINRDTLQKYSMVLNLEELFLSIIIDNKESLIKKDNLKAIYFRAPIYLRENFTKNISKEQQLYKSQWTAFIRNLTIYEDVKWMNNPQSTFLAENKPLQLIYAKRLGFLCPRTFIANSCYPQIDKHKKYIIKTLDTAVLKIDSKEAFVYSNIISGHEIKNYDLSLSPLFIQEYIYPKTDIRVTVVDNNIYAVKILQNGEGINTDWREIKNKVEFVPIKLPQDIEVKCIKLTKSFNLSFGAIDLVETNGRYYFLEINPTGEWAWLVDAAGLKIFEGICDYLEGKK